MGKGDYLQDKFKKSVAKHKAKVAKGEATYSRSRADIQKEVKAKVARDLGLTTVPNTAPPGTKNPGKWASATSTLALNLTGKDQRMYGEEASALTNKYLKQYTGTYGKGGFKTQKGQDLTYGESRGAMGTGDPTGVMSSIPLSSKMLQTQNKIKGYTTALLSLAVPAPLGTVMRVGAAQNLVDAAQPGAAYTDYTKKFQAKQSGKKFTSTRNVLGLLKEQHKKKTLQSSFDKKQEVLSKDGLGSSPANKKDILG